MRVNDRWSRYNAKCKKCGTVTSGLSPGDEARRLETDPKHGPVFDNGRGYFVMRCRGCGALVLAKLVRGKYNPHIECSAKCMSATGTQCECSCGGKNHGAGFSA